MVSGLGGSIRLLLGNSGPAEEFVELAVPINVHMAAVRPQPRSEPEKPA